jgi:hypothetical protein
LCHFISLTSKIRNGITLPVTKDHRINYTDKQGIIDVILRKYFVVNSGHFCRPGSFYRSPNRSKQPFGLQFSFYNKIKPARRRRSFRPNRAEAKWAPQGGAGASGGLQGKEYDQARRHHA